MLLQRPMFYNLRLNRRVVRDLSAAARGLIIYKQRQEGLIMYQRSHQQQNASHKTTSCELMNTYYTVTAWMSDQQLMAVINDHTNNYR